MPGRIVSLNISPEGVPKLPIDRAHVARLGLQGGAHRNTYERLLAHMRKDRGVR